MFIRERLTLTDVEICYSDGAKEKLVGEVEKHVLMSEEAKDFYDYICGSDSDLKKINAEILSVLRAMNTVIIHCNII